MNAPKKQKPQPPATTPAVEAPVNPAPDAPTAAPEVTVEAAVGSRPDDASPGETIGGGELAPGAGPVGFEPVADAQLEAAALALSAEAPAATAGPAPASDTPAAARGNARALRRVEHDGKAYGPGEEAGDVLSLSPAALNALVAIGAVELL